MTEKLSIALAQLNPTVGDIAGNVTKLREARKKAAVQGAHLVVAPELFVSGYPPEDLVLKPSFQAAVRQTVEQFAKETGDGGPAVLVGAPWSDGGKLHNSALMLEGGRIAAIISKSDLPNYGVFDEKRVFTPAPLPEPITFRGVKLGVMVCEDIWTPAAAANLKKLGAQLLLIPNASPYETDKLIERKKQAHARIKETGLPVAYLNTIGGQDELVFDGASFVLDVKGECVVQADAWVEDVIITSWTIGPNGAVPEKGTIKTVPNGAAAIYHALMVGLRDYVNKNGFPGVLIGLSGGIDSALVAALAVDAFGADKLWTVMMPSPYTSSESKEDAAEMAKLLGCQYDIVPIDGAMETYGQALSSVFTGRKPDITEENIQSRSRGIILMAISNKFGPMVISTGNKSEMSVGYSTLYGDLCGGFAGLKDLYKTEVYEVSRWRNANKPTSALGPNGAIIPERIFTKAPTAELRPNQTDQDSLPPYEVLDAILECLIERDMGVKDIIAKGYEAETVKRVWSMMDRAEYKRRQGPPGTKITRREHGRDRRYPITNKYRET